MGAFLPSMQTISKAIPVAQAIGGGLEAYGEIEEGRQMQLAEDYNARVLTQRANILRRQFPLFEVEKEAIATKAEFEKRRMRRAREKLRGKQVAAYGKAGVTLSGSALEVIIDSAAEVELDLNILGYNTKLDLYNVEIEKYKTEVAARGAESEAAYRKVVGRQYARVGYAKAGRTLLSTATDLAIKYGGKKKTIPS